MVVNFRPTNTLSAHGGTLLRAETQHCVLHDSYQSPNEVQSFVLEPNIPTIIILSNVETG